MPSPPTRRVIMLLWFSSAVRALLPMEGPATGTVILVFWTPTDANSVLWKMFGSDERAWRWMASKSTVSSSDNDYLLLDWPMLELFENDWRELLICSTLGTKSPQYPFKNGATSDATNCPSWKLMSSSASCRSPGSWAIVSKLLVVDID